MVRRICKAIIEKRFISFEYVDKKDGYSGKRKVEPYIFGYKHNGAAYLTGFFTPTKKQLKDGKQPIQGHYLLEHIKDLELSDKTFEQLKVNPENIYRTPTITPICVVHFPGIISQLLGGGEKNKILSIEPKVQIK